jgi:hypothetical protein
MPPSLTPLPSLPYVSPTLVQGAPTAGHLVMLYSWGRGEDGQCGNGSTNDQELPTPVEGLRNQSVVQIACGSGRGREGGKEEGRAYA